MAMTTRDKWLAAALPAIIAASIYLYFPGRAAQTQLTKARTELKAEQTQPSAVPALTAAMAEANKLQELLDASRGQAAKLALARPLAAGRGPATIDRGEPLRLISNALASRGLFLVSSERLENSAKTSLPKSIQESWTKLPEANRPPDPQIWRFEIRGSFTSFHEACHELEKSNSFIVPLSVSMEPFSKEEVTKEPGLQRYFKWTLTVWL